MYTQLLKEQLDVHLKIAELDDYISSDEFDSLATRQIELTLKQLSILIEYSDILSLRIKHL